jgi:hypothetical protein
LGTIRGHNPVEPAGSVQAVRSGLLWCQPVLEEHVSTHPRSYRRKPLAIFEHGTRLYAPSAGEDRYRVVAMDVGGSRLFYKFVSEAEARRKAREVESYLANRTPLRSTPDQPRTVAALAHDYLLHLRGRSVRYQERQATFLRHWILPRLGDVTVSNWTPALSEEILTLARRQPFRVWGPAFDRW